MNRRNFIRLSTTATGGLAIAMTVPAVAKGVLDKESFVANVLTEIHADGSITFMLTKHEMGQGTGTGVPMIFCDELGANWDTFKVVQALHDEKYKRFQGTTGGSSGLSSMWHPLRQMAASTREILIRSAARHWGVSRDGLYTENGFVKNPSTNAKVNFGDLVSIAPKVEIPDTDEIKLKDLKEFKLIGHGVQNRITPKIVRGEKHFALDLKRPGMVYASIERCPVYRGKVKTYDETACRQVKGVIDVIRVPEIYEDDDFIVRDGVAIIAQNTWAAMQGRKALKVEWEPGLNGSANNASLTKKMRALASVSGEKSNDYYGNFGDVEKAISEADEVLTATYENPYHAHACMEPMNGIAEFKDGHLEVWSTMQNPNWASEQITKYVNVPVENQTIHILPAGGSFGRKFYPEHVTEVAFLASKLNAPVKLTWTREDDIRCDYNSAFQHDNHSVALKDGQVTAWHTNVVSTKSWSPEPWFPYVVPNKLGEQHIIDSPLTPGAWRSVGAHRAAFASEGMMDEIAHKLGKDPLAFRLEMLGREIELGEDAQKHYNQPYSVDAIKKTRQVLELAAKKADWGKRMSRNSGQGLAVYRFSRSFCAQVVEVNVRRGKLRVDKVTAVLYCGTAVNPHLVKGQIEGAIIWALTSVLYGGMDFKDGRVQQSNFHDYKMLRMNETPEIEVHIVPNTDPAVGVGEPGVPPFTPALMNAIFAATGKRIRKTPLDMAELA
ncbi:MAG: xanthine dehydrogenase family protein molybdopterin-binding subunit [Roseivirga sp.]|nr:xanthine dehydrogenase family protein molybdopterin-binding subunit [Roseivirga sp.]